ncbi:hypothetical protein R3X28_19115 [Maribacter sp. TH_r10]|uniref:hypothetical protein n=1 Tax=Maribacter sp. TH_r10 TaxID=3082086 RepID=UPI00295462A0|nr:hypothetical protein [Maribacter sp. TH_r10]MDV7141001.1 hypothetical protein [Maribacter sp. TH_r10]
MRTSPLLLLICLFFFQCSSNKRTLTDLDKIGLKGNVKYLKFTSQSTEGSGGLSNTQNEGEGIKIDNEFFFNEYGMISEQRQYSSSKLSQIFVYKYDHRNLLISKDYFNASNELVMKSKFENTLDSNGQIIEQAEFRAIENSLTDSTEIVYQKTPYEIMKFSYNQSGELSKMTYIQSVFGADFPKNVIEYKNGLMDKQFITDSNENVVSSNDVKYMEFDKMGNCIKIKTIGNSPTEEFTNAEIKYYK